MMKNFSLMKRLMIRSTVICMFLGMQQAGFSQITIGNSDMPSAGDTIRTSTGLNVDLYDFEETGEDYLWDYSDLVSITQSVDTFVSVIETPILYWPFFLLSANLASPIIQDSPLPEIPLTDVYNFYNNSSNNYKDVGFAANLFGLPLPFNYDSPDILYEFPMNYGNVDSSESGFNFGLENLGFIMVERKRVNTVDGWGTLITPYGTFEVLRLKSEVTEYDSIYIDSISVGIPLTREYTEYKWLGKDQKIPLLQVTDDLLGLVVTYIDSLIITSSDNDNQISVKEQSLRVYPNPTSGILNVEFDDHFNQEFEVVLYDIRGRIVQTWIQHGNNNGSFQTDLGNLLHERGQYFVKILIGKQTFTRKLIYLPE